MSILDRMDRAGCPHDEGPALASFCIFCLQRAVIKFHDLESEAANEIEQWVVMNTHFTGSPPYVGWKGIGLALREHVERLENDVKLARREVELLRRED